MDLRERHEMYMQKREEERKELKEFLIFGIPTIILSFVSVWLLSAIAMIN